MTHTEALRLALEALESCWEIGMPNACQKKEDAITAIKAILAPRNELETHWNEMRASYGARQAALEAKDEPVGLIESLKDAQPCCGQYETCWRACTPRGKFIGHRDAQRKPLTNEQFQAIRNSLFRQDGWDGDGWDLALKEAIEAAHGIKGKNA